jgi:hypothetical protein
MYSQIAPVLSGHYNFDDEYMVLRNTGNGPVYQLRAQKTNEHFIDIKTIVSYELDKDCLSTVDKGEEAKIAFLQVGSKNATPSERKLTNFFIKQIATKLGRFGMIYKDVLGKSWMVKLRFVDTKGSGWVIETLETARYGLIYRIWDNIDSARFKMLKPYREWRLSEARRIKRI